MNPAWDGFCTGLKTHVWGGYNRAVFPGAPSSMPWGIGSRPREPWQDLTSVAAITRNLPKRATSRLCLPAEPGLADPQEHLGFFTIQQPLILGLNESGYLLVRETLVKLGHDTLLITVRAPSMGVHFANENESSFKLQRVHL
jgi:hypothetical protein